MKGRRFGLRGKKAQSDAGESDTQTSASASYVPPPVLDDNPESLQAGYVTQPPKPSKGLTGKISTLFRREANNEYHSSGRPTSGRTRDISDNVSVGSNMSHSKRIFYSSNDDNDSDDSYESRVSRASRTSRGSHSHISHNRSVASEGDYHSEAESGVSTVTDANRSVLRYRGFSTSIRSIFLDEALVCASMGCFGLILSNRTEYLLQIRNERRGALSPRRDRSDRKRLPSRIVAYGLIVTLILMFATFVVWGFGTGNGLARDYLYGYDYDDGVFLDDTPEEQVYDDANNQQWWDDYLVNDDGANAQDDAAAYDDDAYAGDDGGNNGQADDAYAYNNNGDDAYAGDDAAANNYDDAAANNYDDAAANNYDDAAANNYDDAAANNYDDAAGNGDDAAANGDDADNGNNNNYYGNDDYYAADDDGGRQRSLEIDSMGRFIAHKPRGIMKLRDYEENLWTPIYEFVQAEWNRNDVVVKPDRRVEEQDYGDGERATLHERNIASNIRIGLLFAFLIFLGILGRRRRMRTRFYIVRARAQEDHLYYASSDAAAARRAAFEDSREDQYEGACSHTLCGCYPVDENEGTHVDDDPVLVTDDGIFKVKQRSHNEDFVARGFNCITAACCGLVCKCWFQCLSICALAQEAREIRLLLPPRYQRVDYITHQPFHEYQKEVNDLRRGWLGKTRKKSGFMPHYNALSRLSRYIMIYFTLAIVVIAATLIFNPLAAFSWQDAVVLAATFLQSFLVLFIVHWIFHKSDLSLDAVIKFFAAGFLIAFPTAFVFEGLVVNIVVLFSLLGYHIFRLCFGEAFTDWLFAHWRLVWILGEFFNAYVVAAILEELCKYYAFRAVEHPDLVFLTGLQRAEQDETAVDGGLIRYPFASYKVQELIRESSMNDEASLGSRRSGKSGYSKRSRRSRRGRDEAFIERTGTTESEFYEDDHDARTHRQKAMAITTGMISVAIGLACAENCIYVFVLGGALGNGQENHRGDMIEAWIVLFFRSIFPIHALAAAMQSVNMIRKFVESSDDNGHRIGVGRIILPAVILHGSFDAILLGINVYVETAWNSYMVENAGNIGDDDPYNAVIVNLVAWISITLIMLAGMAWYYRENRIQRLRLILLEEKEKASLAGVEWEPTTPQKEIELV